MIPAIINLQNTLGDDYNIIKAPARRFIPENESYYEAIRRLYK